MNELKSNIGLIVLSISIIVASVILTQNKIAYKQDSGNEFNSNKIRLTGDSPSDQTPIGINTNSNDVTYNSGLKIGEGGSLVIQLKNGTIQRIEGKNITAKYYHVGKLLIVEYEYQEKKMLRYFDSPITWGNEK